MRWPSVHVSAGERFGAGPFHGAAMRIGSGLRVFRRIGDRHRRGAPPLDPGVVRCRFSIESEVKDFADRLTGVLRRGEPLPLAGAQKQRFSVGCKGNDRAELSTLAACRVMPQPGQSLKTVAGWISNQFRPRQRKAAAAIWRGLGVGQIDQIILGKGRRESHIKKTALALNAITRGAPETGCLAPFATSTSQMRPGFSVTIPMFDPGTKAIAQGELKVATCPTTNGRLPTGPGSAACAPLEASPDPFEVFAATPHAATRRKRPYRATCILMTFAPFYR